MIALPFDKTKVIEICSKYGIHSIRVFGSLARGEGRRESDIDFLVAFSRKISLLKLVALERELTQALGRKVDLVTEASISPYLRDRILEESQIIYAAR